MGSIFLLTGGARSGKSEIAERMVGGPDRRVCYVATARPHGREMVARIDRHKKRRPEKWRTIESPLDPRGALTQVDSDADAVMLECLYVWVVNRLMALGDSTKDDWLGRVEALEDALVAETREMCSIARAARWRLVLVTSEIGLGTVPETARPRAFRDLLGTVNRTAAAEADEARLVVAGLSIELKTRPSTG
jgi:adenosylcobinamide kinase/adenosylcobinamide-phosphate guanylyltransferase